MKKQNERKRMYLGVLGILALFSFGCRQVNPSIPGEDISAKLPVIEDGLFLLKGEVLPLVALETTDSGPLASWEIISGPGEISADGELIGTDTGEVSLVVTTQTGESIDAVVTVYDVTLQADALRKFEDDQTFYVHAEILPESVTPMDIGLIYQVENESGTAVGTMNETTKIYEVVGVDQGSVLAVATFDGYSRELPLEVVGKFIIAMENANSTWTGSLPLVTGDSYNLQVRWGEGLEPVNVRTLEDAFHQYTSSGKKTIEIWADTPEELTFGPAYGRWSYMVEYGSNPPYAATFTDVLQFGGVRFIDNETTFAYTLPATFTATDYPYLEGSVVGMFRESFLFNGNINHWDVSKVTNFQSMFLGAKSYNQPMDQWDLSSATNMVAMFFTSTRTFDQNMSTWTNWTWREGVDYLNIFIFTQVESRIDSGTPPEEILPPGFANIAGDPLL